MWNLLESAIVRNPVNLLDDNLVPNHGRVEEGQSLVVFMFVAPPTGTLKISPCATFHQYR